MTLDANVISNMLKSIVNAVLDLVAAAICFQFGGILGWTAGLSALFSGYVCFMYFMELCEELREQRKEDVS